MLGTPLPCIPTLPLLSSGLGTGLGASPRDAARFPGMVKLQRSPALGKVALSGDTGVAIAGVGGGVCVSLILTKAPLPPFSVLQHLLQGGAPLAALPCRRWGPSPPQTPPGTQQRGGT